ncbi:acyl-CoA dehydrogenase family protein [Pseudooceanicola sp. CBS1P-1]|uniref:Flavin-dependent monooxygenase n=1 Tax=Pseudooceanicola albus TaxID=2692189 RepID=A0A6L7G8X8_9RHOB|nr:MULTISPECIES: acyl-CoA dehydrogenase family protein [Pseudooceanicola]MBT9386492.1 acyl-CoA dehydrogenase family protein [Pseudooceanicola endophyticus]MXN20525.1 flavin-dependent monooxygenase [Pseudooceanicola albus]
MSALADIPTDPQAVTLATVLDEIRHRRAEFERLSHVPSDMVAKLQAVGCYRAFVPTRFGGDALSPAAFCRLIEQIATADASTGWVASFGVSSTYLAALPPETFRTIYGRDPNTVFAGAMFPPQAATREGDRLRVSGRWPWCSGSMGASLIGVGIKIEGEATPLPRSAIFPAEQVRIDQTWDTIGLRATGSHDVVVEDRLVDMDWTFVRGSAPQMDDAIFRYPAMALAAQVLAVVGLGTAREALDWIRSDAAQKASITGAPNPGQRPYIQSDLAKAEAILGGARAHFYDVIEDAWQQMQAAGEVTPDTRIRLRLVATQAAHQAAEAARMAFVMGGSGAMMAGHPLGRCMLDAACVAQHAFMNSGTWTAAGAGMFAQQTPPGYP